MADYMQLAQPLMNVAVGVAILWHGIGVRINIRDINSLNRRVLKQQIRIKELEDNVKKYDQKTRTIY